jgi:DMSO/TMAO reductase YedYZ molybdopterin-dependent catalytic subunit
VTPTPTPTHKPKPKPKPKPTPAPYFTVVGNVAKTTTFTVAQLEKMPTVSATYFSRGGHPTTETETPCVGVRLIDILNAAGIASDASRVTVTGADNYSATFTMAQVEATYIDETRPGVKLPMIIAYSENGKQLTGDHPFQVVMGETVAGEYNRMYWVYIVKTITVQ